MKRIIIILCCCLFSSTLLGQEKITSERKKVDSIFRVNLLRNDFKDTNMVYMFALKLNVVKNKSGNAKIQSVNVSDSSAFRIYKDLGFLSEINYKLFMGTNPNATFVFPVCVLLEYPDKPNAGFVNMEELQRKMEHYWFRKDYYNEPTDKYIYIPISVLRTSTVKSY